MDPKGFHIGPKSSHMGPKVCHKGPKRSQMGPQNGKCAETARGVFRNEGGVQITVGFPRIDRGEGVYINME